MGAIHFVPWREGWVCMVPTACPQSATIVREGELPYACPLPPFPDAEYHMRTRRHPFVNTMQGLYR